MKFYINSALCFLLLYLAAALAELSINPVSWAKEVRWIYSIILCLYTLIVLAFVKDRKEQDEKNENDLRRYDTFLKFYGEGKAPDFKEFNEINKNF